MKIKIDKSFLMIGALIFLWVSDLMGQQLPQFSQYMFNGLHINPGYAGYKNEGYIQSTYRSQWGDFPGAPKTFSVSADLSANEGRMGFGVLLLKDQIGPTEYKAGTLTYSYRVQIATKSYLGLGVSSGFSEYMLDPSKMILTDPDDPLLPGGIVRKAVPNLNTGLFFHSEKYYMGFSVFNMIGKKGLKSKDVALAYHDFHYYITLGALYLLTDGVQFKPSVLVKHTKGSPTSFDLNAMFLFRERLWLGGAYRSNARVFEDELQVRRELNMRTALVGLMEVFVSDKLRLGYAYDHNLNVLNSYRNNSHEFSLGYYLKSKNTIMKNPRWF
jgi:type IX secretion system PorP/SprF family membrane protein